MPRTILSARCFAIAATACTLKWIQGQAEKTREDRMLGLSVGVPIVIIVVVAAIVVVFVLARRR